MDTKPWYKAEWWAAALYAVIVVLNYYLGLGIDVAPLVALVVPVLAIIFGDKWVEVQKVQLEMLKVELQLYEKQK